MVPPTVLAAALSQVRAQGADSPLLPALLSRADVPLDALTPACLPTTELNDLAAAAYIARPEHTPARVLELLAADDRSRVRVHLLRLPRVNDTARQAALQAASLNGVRQATGNSSLPVAVRAAAVSRWLELIGDLPANMAAHERKELLAYLDALKLEAIADALARHVRDSEVLVKACRYVRTPEAADRIAEVFIGPALHGDPTAIRPLGEVLGSTHYISALCSPSTRAQLAQWWEQVDLATLPHERNPYLNRPWVADVVARLRGCGVDGRVWRVLRDEPIGDGSEAVELASHLAAAFGDDADLWAVYLKIADTFTGTVAQLVDTVRAIATAPA